MLRSDAQWLAIADEFYAAAVDHSRWYPALQGLAAATGSRSGELISIGSDAAIPINIMTDMDPQVHVAAVECSVGDPAVNPRVDAGMRAPLLEVVAECDFLTPDEHARHPHYDEFARPWDIPYICLATLERQNDLLIGLAVLRSEREGHIGSAEREVFESLAPHVRAAVRMQIALEGNGAALLKGTLEGLAIPAFVCGRTGDVQALTAQAEALANGARGLTLRNLRLRAAREDEDKALNAAIMKAAHALQRPGGPSAQTVVVRDAAETSAPLVLDVMPLPSAQLEFSSAPRVLVVARGMRGPDAAKAAVLQGVYGLTSAEIDITLQLAQGKSTAAISRDREVAIGTVRAQIKSVLAKLGVGRQMELVARLSEL